MAVFGGVVCLFTMRWWFQTVEVVAWAFIGEDGNLMVAMVVNGWVVV